MAMSVNLTPHLENMVKQKIASGLYSSANEVISEALYAFENQHIINSIKLERLRQDIQDGLNSGESTLWNPEEIKRKGRELRAAKMNKNSVE